MLGSVVNPLSASLAAPGIRRSSLPRISVRLIVGGRRFPSTTIVSNLTASPKYILISVVSPLLMATEIEVGVVSSGCVTTKV